MATTNRYICIHGHFYQPPRENPWLEAVETQDSAAPYHDWNERITAECYATNGAARILTNKGLIRRIVNNYARISFNIGATLLSWLAQKAPRAYRTLLDGEKRSRKLYNGHSSAMAQVYNHIILPLASTRDRITQIRWGIADYKHHYGLMPEGMWLAETAADNESLELMAAEGIKFTVLAPHQCRRIRSIHHGGEWIGTPGATVDTTRPYRVSFASGLSIAVFFYDGPTSRAIAFEGLLNSGEDFSGRLKTGFKDNQQVQLEHVATDGESYGHHHRHGEMALAYALEILEKDHTVELINYGSFLEKFPPEYEAEIVENTSWSCIHGIERWRSNCGCNGGKGGYNQAWRGPLRQALDELRDAIAPLKTKIGNPLLRDVWAARDAYIQVILDRTPETIDAFLAAQTNPKLGRTLNADERVRVLSLMEMQRHAQLMYTSCGWFFDDISGIETVQVIAYAGRVLQLAKELFGKKAIDLEKSFLARLAEAKSNVPTAGDGAKIYHQIVRTTSLGLEQVAAHYAISSVFSNYGDETDLFCYQVRRISHAICTSGRGRLALGRTEVTSEITERKQSFSYAVLHFGDQNITAAVKAYTDSEAAAFDEFAQRVTEFVQQANFPEAIRALDRFYGHVDYSLSSLFSDEQRRIIALILDSTLSDIERSLTTIYESHTSLMHYLSNAGLPKPAALTLAAGFAINAGLRRVLDADTLDGAMLKSFVALAKADQIPLDTNTLHYIADQRMMRAMIELQMSSGSIELLDRALNLARILLELSFEQNLWKAQNIWYEIFRSAGYALTSLSSEDLPHWQAGFRELATCLAIDYDAISAATPTATNTEIAK